MAASHLSTLTGHFILLILKCLLTKYNKKSFLPKTFDTRVFKLDCIMILPPCVCFLRSDGRGGHYELGCF